MAFKIGDRVRMREGAYQVVPVGNEGVIIEAEMRLPFPYRVKWDGVRMWDSLHIERELEAI